MHIIYNFFFFCMPSTLTLHNHPSPVFVFQDTGSSYLFIPSLIPDEESHHVEFREIVMVDVGAEKRHDFGHYGGHHAGHKVGPFLEST